MSWRADAVLAEALRVLAPQSLLCVGRGPVPAVEAYAAVHPRCDLVRVDGYPDQALPQGEGRRFDVGVVVGLLEALPDNGARALIAALRDRHCRTLLLVAPKAHWRLADYLALGFERRAEDDAHELYWFDLDRYNPEREWNNPSSWAHPENFRRFRW